jgi:hypothetical protein
MRLDSQEDDICRPGFFQRADDSGAGLEVSFYAPDTHTMFLHGFQVWAAGEQGYVESRTCQARTHVCTDRSRARDQESHA